MVKLDLTWDLVEEILCRVPSKSLRRLRLTCKRWNDLCNDPNFIKKKWDQATKKNPVLMIRNFKVYSLILKPVLNEIDNNIVVVDPSIEFTSSKLKSLNDLDINEVFHCNGLLLCSMKVSHKTQLVVVNPCTGQTRWIETKYDRYVLGYDNNGSYKILRFPYDWSQSEIFDLNSDSWRVLANIAHNIDLWTYGRGVSLKGNAYWMSRGGILSFDFTTESFRRFCFPLPSRFRYSYKIALSVVKEEQLSLLVHTNSELEIWVNKMDTKTVFSWSKCLTLDISYRELYYHFSSHGSFIFDQEKEMVMYCRRSRDKRKNVLFIVSKHGYKIFTYDKDQSKHHCYPFVFTYFPTFVSLYPPPM